TGGGDAPPRSAKVGPSGGPAPSRKYYVLGTRWFRRARTTRPARGSILSPMNELALQQQRTVDRVALIGSTLAILAAAAFVTLDPVQNVARRPSSPAAHVTPAPATAADHSPLVELALPSPAWTIVTDGTWAACARLEAGQPAEVVARALHRDASHVVYRAGASSYLGQL